MMAYVRVLSSLLAASMLVSCVPAAGAASPKRTENLPLAASPSAPVTGSIEAAVRLDFAQDADTLRARDVKAVLQGEGLALTASLWENDSLSGQVKQVWREGGNSVPVIGLTFDSLPAGNYTLTFSGEGYVTCENEIEIQDRSRFIAVGTGDGTFALGNLNGDNVVDNQDVALISEALSRETLSPEEKARFDLNGDGEVDIVDLAIVNHSAAFGQDGQTEITNTQFLIPPDGAVSAGDDGTDMTTVGEEDAPGTIAGLMDRAVLTRLIRKDQSEISAAKPVSAEIRFDSSVEMSQLKILTPVAGGQIQDGDVTVTYEEEETGREETLTIPFKNQIPSDIHLYGEDGEDVRTITINLGKRVAVKKITITVTKTGDNQYADVAAIEFLEDIVPENPIPQNVTVRSLTADPGSGQVGLKWAALPNITGYEIVYYKSEGGTASDNAPSYTTTTTATVTGLDNGDPYTFQVTPVSRDPSGKVVWRGVTAACEATPETTKAPAKVNMVNVKEGDGSLTVSWKAVKDAETYQVDYSTDKDLKNPQSVSGIEGTSTSLTGLKNETTYYLRVRAKNRIGEGPASNTVSGTPKAVSYEVEGIPTEGLLDRSKIQSIRLLDPNNVAPGYTPPFSADYMIDGDYKTHWTAKEWSRNEHVEVTFTEPVGLSAALWVPRLDGDYPKWLRCYSVRVWTDEAHGGLDGKLIVPDEDHGGRDDGATGNSSAMFTWPDVRNNPAQTNFAVLPFGPLEGITKIQLAVEQRAYNRVSLSELMFMEYDPDTDIPTQIAALFSDTLLTGLAPGVTRERIDALKAELEARQNYCLYPDTLLDELELASELLEGGESSGVVRRGLNSLASQNGGSALQPLGVSADANSTITIYADLPAGEKVEVFATQVNAEASAWRASLGTLVNGRNVLTVPKIGSQASNSGGSLYYTYSGSNGSRIGLHIRRATDIPILDVVNWYDMTDSQRQSAIAAYVEEAKRYRAALSDTNAGNPKNVTEISTPSVLLSIPATAFPATADTAAQSLENSILAWEQFMQICRYTQGIETADGQNIYAARQNIRCMQMFEGAFMYAAGSHIGIGAGSCAGMVSGSPVTDGFSGTSNRLFGWGIAHETGHNMDLLGKAEITNNIYSIMVQTFDGKANTLTSRLEASGKYPKVFDKVAQKQPGASNDVFVQLGLYWQLHLAYDGADKPMEFYHEFFKLWKAGDWGPAATYDEKVAVVASRAAGKDLTEFFERWGMTLSQTVKDTLRTLGSEPRAIWYLNDQSRRDRLSGTESASGTFTVTAEVQNDKDVALSISPQITGKVQGYEIRRDGSSIGFAVANADGSAAYTDHIGSANHMAFQYEVAAYDSLGNQIGAAQPSNEVRIAYDLTVPTDDYTIRRENDKVIVEFKTETSVSGLKLSGTDGHAVPSSGAYTVTATVTADGTTSTVTARSADFSMESIPTDDGCYLTYFNKPGTDSMDTRIWTYDVKQLEITGIPDDFPLESVQIVSYAGDDVAFYPGAAVGIMAHDYGEIKQGSLVIIGTYRGGPVHQLLRVEGEFTKTYTDTADDTEKTVTETRYLDGTLYLFAEVHGDKDVSDISDGLFIFVPNVQREAELQSQKGDETVSNCSGVNLLPSRMRIVMTRSSTPDEAVGERLTATTLWMETPGGTEEDLPRIELKND